MTRRVLHTWHRRWFVFDRAHRTLSWHNSRHHSAAVCRRSRHSHSLPFNDIVDVFLDHLRSVRSPAPHLTFCVKTPTDCIYLVAASAELLRIWVDVIVTGAEGYQQVWWRHVMSRDVIIIITDIDDWYCWLTVNSTAANTKRLSRVIYSSWAAAADDHLIMFSSFHLCVCLCVCLSVLMCYPLFLSFTLYISLLML